MAKILLIDDDEDLVMSLRVYLQFKNHVVETAGSAEDGLAKMDSGGYDLIVLDWNLPDRDGLDVCKEYRSRGGAQKILMLTGMRDEQSREQGLAAGATDFLEKPFSPSFFIERVAAMVGE